MTPSATLRGGRQQTWTRDSTIEALRRYAELYGPDFTAASFSPSTAKWRDEPELIDRYYEGDPDGIGPWPSLNAIKSHFGGSFNAARVAAGLTANRPGPSKRRRPDGMHKPIRGVSHATATRTVFVPKVGTEREVERLTTALAKAETRAERAERALERSRATKRTVTKVKTKTRTKTRVVRERVADTRALEREKAKTAKIATELVEAKADAKEARTAATRIAFRLERAEATINTLRGERRELKTGLDRAEKEIVAIEDRLTATERLLREAEAATPVETTVVSAEAEEVAEARRFRREAEVRVAAAERRERELVALVKGEERQFTPAEIAELRAGGPSGPAVLGAALNDLARARKVGGAPPLRKALYKLASAAITWRERL